MSFLKPDDRQYPHSGKARIRGKGSLTEMAARPALFERSTAAFWDDPHISQQMLTAHLDSSHDAASRRPETIDRSVAWIASYLGLTSGAQLLDLGCGPGLYCRRFAQAGIGVTGMDYSRRAIEYASVDAWEHGLPIAYVYQNYLDMEYENAFDVISLIYLDLCALTDDERAQLLPRVHHALRPGGVFVFDILTLNYFSRLAETQSWELQPDGGFWHPDPYLELRAVFLYPEADADVHQYLILPDDRRPILHRVWNRSFSPAGISALLEQHGFEIENCWSDLAGTPWDFASETMGVVARKSR